VEVGLLKYFLAASLVFSALLSSCAAKVGPVTTAKPPMQFVKGQTHLHTNNSGDSQTPPQEVAQWYAQRGYDFIVFTDHNSVTAPLENAPLLTFAGTELTQNSRDCTPPPLPGLGCLLHMNALFIDTPPAEIPWPPTNSKDRTEIYQKALTATQAMGAIAQLNHPNFHYGANAKIITEMGRRGVFLLEMANQSVDINNEGDAAHPNTEALWDEVLTAGVKMFAVASDDAHHYNDAKELEARGEEFFIGDLGFIMVHASKDPKEIKAGIIRGDFYSSNGVFLERYEATQEAIEVVVSAKPERKYTIVFIGEGGKVLAKQEGNSARFSLSKAKGYVRARVDDDAGKHAWLQPVWLTP
jgi:histidinol phosphatase-like PHP family hydrolase